MKKIYLILALCLVGMSARAQEQLPKWAQDLIALNSGVIFRN